MSVVYPKMAIMNFGITLATMINAQYRSQAEEAGLSQANAVMLFLYFRIAFLQLMVETDSKNTRLNITDKFIIIK